MTVVLPPSLVRSAIISFFLRFESTLVTGVKIETRRVWKNEGKFRSHIIALKNGLFVRAWCGTKGRQIGYVRYLSIEPQRLEEMTTDDVGNEGCPGMSVLEFCELEFPSISLTTEVWVVRFVFIPLHTL